METKNEQSVGQTHEKEQSQGVAAVASGSALRNPWSWRMGVSTLIPGSMTLGLGVGQMDVYGFALASMSTITVWLSVVQIKNAFRWEQASLPNIQ